MIHDVVQRTYGYGVCADCSVAVQRFLLDRQVHACDPERYAAHQARKLHWRRAGFEDAFAGWLTTRAGRFAQFYARRLLAAGRPGDEMA
jgi:hypothetical protein